MLSDRIKISFEIDPYKWDLTFQVIESMVRLSYARGEKAIYWLHFCFIFRPIFVHKNTDIGFDTVYMEYSLLKRIEFKLDNKFSQTWHLF